MTKSDINKELEALLENESTSEILDKVKELRTSYHEIEVKENEAAKEAFVKEGGEEADFSPTRDDEDKRFMDLMTEFNKRKKEWDERQKKSEEENLAKKQALIDELKKLIKEETNIAASFRGLNQIKAKWDSIGKVPNERYKELQHDFSLQLEYFYYNIDIYKTLKEYDLEKNLKIKRGLIEKMKGLLEVKSIKEVRAQVEILMNEWDQAGPTFQDKWKEVRDEFWNTAAQVHKKIKDHYTNRKETYKNNLEAKQALCAKVEEINNRELNTEKQWRKATETVIQCQKDWKEIGFATKKHNQEVWEKFRALMDDFFNAKKKFYDQQKSVYNEFADKKEALIKEAEALKDSTNWKETTIAFKKLQKQWRDVGHAGQQRESKLWKRFNGAANHFFEAKKHYYDTIDDRMADNLKKKIAIVEEIKSLKLSGDKEADMKSLKELTVAWNDAGMIEKKNTGEAKKALDKALDEKYDEIGLKKNEKESTKFTAKMESIRNADNSNDLLLNERKKIKDQIRKLEAELVQYENNLGFFSNASSDNPLLKTANEKIEQTKEELERLRDKLRLVHS